MDWVIKATVFIISSWIFWQFMQALRLHSQPLVDSVHKYKLYFTGFLANIADTLGVGSFAVVVACNRYWQMVDDKKLPGTLNAHSILPALLQSLFFLQVVTIDIITLLTLVGGACLGGVLGGLWVSQLNKHAIRLFMFLGYFVIACLLFANLLRILPVGGDAMSLNGQYLFIGFVGMIIAGTLPAVGVGAYAPTQMILFLLGMSPIVAFPIMATAGAIQQSVTCYTFVVKKQVAFRESLLMGLAGIFGVLFAAPFITSIDTEILRWLLLAIVVYNIIMLGFTVRNDHVRNKNVASTSSGTTSLG